MLIAPRAAGGAPGPRLRPASPAQVRLAGRQEGGITSGGATGLGGAAHSAKKNGGAPAEKSMFPKIFAKYYLQIKKKLMQKKKVALPPSFPSLSSSF